MLGKKLSKAEAIGAPRNAISTLPPETERELFKVFWRWLSIVGGIVSVITIAAWVIMSAGFGGVARDAANREARGAVARLQGEVDRLQRETQALRNASQNALSETQAARGQVREIAQAAKTLAADAESSAATAKRELEELQTYSVAYRAKPNGSGSAEGEVPTAAEVADALSKIPNFKQVLAAEALESLNGIVVASTVRCSALGAAWQTFDEGAGRVVVGVGTEDISGTTRSFSPEDKGGFWEHKLTIDEMPAHTHLRYGPFFSTRTPDGFHNLPPHDREAGEYAIRTPGEEGANKSEYLEDSIGQPHNNMPPYIALHFCKKLPVKEKGR